MQASNSSELGGLGGPALGFRSNFGITSRTGIGFSLGGFQATSTITQAGQSVTLKVKDVAVPILVRYYFAEPSHPRLYIEGGPSVHFLKNTVSSANLGGLGGNASSTKPGGTVNVGGHIPFSKSWAFELATGFTFVPKFNNVKYSNFTMTVGIGHFSIR